MAQKSRKPAGGQVLIGASEVEGIRPLLSKAETTRILGISLRTLDGLISHRLLPAIKVGRQVRIRPRDLVDLEVCGD